MSKVFALPLPLFGSLLSPSRRPAASRSKIAYSTAGRKGFKLNYTLLAAAAVMLVGYLVAVNVNASLGYKVTSLHRNIDKLTQDNQKLMIQLSEANSLASPQIDNQQWVSVKSAEFLAAPQHFSER